MRRWRWYRRLRFAFKVTDRDLENINFLCDRYLESGWVFSFAFRDEVTRLHNLVVDAS